MRSSVCRCFFYGLNVLMNEIMLCILVLTNCLIPQLLNGYRNASVWNNNNHYYYRDFATLSADKKNHLLALFELPSSSAYISSHITYRHISVIKNLNWKFSTNMSVFFDVKQQQHWSLDIAKKKDINQWWDFEIENIFTVNDPRFQLHWHNSTQFY